MDSGGPTEETNIAVFGANSANGSNGMNSANSANAMNGANGPTGRLVAARATAAGHRVTAVTRHPGAR
ncbi:hypothetical protein ABZ719_20615 [Streptomyces sp. NPDC006743]|uniref:hypothetical protein n=1 Tax=Streptomyces sp. NPDC006743 TaxID=3154480 RepID=UPI0034525FC1